MSSIFVEYKDQITFHPGYFVKEWIDEEAMSQEEFANRVGTTPKTISKLINGLTPLTTAMARSIAIVTGTSIELWTSLQNRFSIASDQIAAMKEIDDEKCLLSRSVRDYYVSIGVLSSKMDTNQMIAELRRFFRFSTLNLLNAPMSGVNYKADAIGKSAPDHFLTNIWVQTMMNRSNEIETEPFSATRLQSLLGSLRAMTRQDPNDFFAPLQDRLRQCGVALVVLPYLPKSHIKGATKWSGNNRVVIGLNNQRKVADQLWFTLFHEMYHVLEQSYKEVSIEFDNQRSESDSERNADQFASDLLIPPREYARLRLLSNLNIEAVKQFASEIDVHPGIVVGRLQHDRVIPQSQWNECKVYYEVTTSESV
jgi:HTH-type transcriptional regulator / antitoxin HigA